jgi:triacylglycerol esterase/lipase EstA (alpha/beta hydrolase family)
VHRRTRWGGLATAGVSLLVLVAWLWPAVGAQASPLPIGNLVTGLISEAQNPNATPPGSNIWSCRVTAEHPYPVILVHGTGGTATVSWQALSPMLANAGYCVYAYNYGATSDTHGYLYALGDITSSAEQLSQVVQLVLAATGASQVDIVGHSQGGMMPRDYMKFFGGDAFVHMLVGLAPSNHGTTFDGLTDLTGLFGSAGQAAEDGFLDAAGCPACQQQMAGSPFLTQLNAGGDTQPGPRYVVIESRYDEVVTPYTSAFLTGPNVDNILLQNQCPNDFTEHLGILYDGVALQDIMNALGPDDPNFAPVCSLVFPGVGSLQP